MDGFVTLRNVKKYIRWVKFRSWLRQESTLRSSAVNLRGSRSQRCRKDNGSEYSGRHGHGLRKEKCW